VNTELIGKLDINNPYQKFKLEKKDVTRLRQFRQSVSKKLKHKFYDLPDNWRIAKRSTTLWLFKEQKNNFDLWWSDDLVDIKDWSYQLVMLNPVFFDSWWDSEKWSWNHRSDALCRFQNSNFEKWWDPEKYNWQDYSYSLADFCYDNFYEWWDPEKYNWNDLSSLAANCKEYFDNWWLVNKITPYIYKRACASFAEFLPDEFPIWWRTNLFHYSHNGKTALLQNCADYFHVWWKDEEFDKDWFKYNSSYMAGNHSKNFKIWFDKKKYNYGENPLKGIRSYHRPIGRHALMRYCPEHFNDWWDKQRIRPNQVNFDLLTEKCQAHKNKWNGEMIIFELGKEID
jgi:hypothetical protein